MSVPLHNSSPLSFSHLWRKTVQWNLSGCSRRWTCSSPMCTDHHYDMDSPGRPQCTDPLVSDTLASLTLGLDSWKNQWCLENVFLSLQFCPPTWPAPPAVHWDHWWPGPWHIPPVHPGHCPAHLETRALEEAWPEEERLPGKAALSESNERALLQQNNRV